MIEFKRQNEELATIKKAGELEVCSEADFQYRIREIAKCKRDICYFAEKYFKIINLDKGLMTIKLYEKQKELLRFFTGEKRCIVLASRQSSKTTTYTIYALWLTQFFPEKKIMLLANKADTALEILSRIRLAYEYLPKWLKQGVFVYNKGEVVFANQSQIKGFATASDAARGYSSTVVIADEFAFVPNNIASKVFESIYPVISSSKNSQFIIVSTPNGADMKNLYYEIWQKANSKEKNKNVEGWKAFRFDWWDVPGRDEQWKKDTIASIGEQRFAQEFGNEFLASSTVKKLIPDDIIEKYRIQLGETKALDPDFAFGKSQQISNDAKDKWYEFTMWHEFDPQCTYLASGDCSDGVGRDASVLYVWNVSDLQNIVQCAKFSSNTVSPVEFAFVTSKILGLYSNPPYVCERNGVGSGYLDSLQLTYGYQNIVKEGRKGERGVFSHVTVKGKVCIWAREMMTTQGFGWTLYDRDLLDEFDTFVRKDNKGVYMIYQAVPPAHDDHVMAWVWAAYILQPDIVERYFVCAKTFTSQLGKIYPQVLLPYSEYNEADIKKVVDDPMHKAFLDFKDEICHKIGKAMFEMKKEDENDIFQKMQRDPYFGDVDDGRSWHIPESTYRNPDLNRGSAPQCYVF